MYYKRVSGKWKRITNKVGMKSEKGKRKDMAGGSDDYNMFVKGKLPKEPRESDESLDESGEKALVKKRKEYRENMDNIYKNYFFK